jgi:DNA invertase Pin-like site-specific DNA recombinase
MVPRARYRRQPLYGMVHPETRRAVLYVRYSSDMQRESWSVDAQLADLRRYCAQHSWEVVGEFIDEAKSGKNDQRPEFQKALATIRDGMATVMVVHKIDRFSRNMEDTFRLVHEFEDLGAGLVCTQQGIDTTNPITGKIVLAVLAALAESYLDNLSEETSKGKRARAQAGLPNGDVPYGYRNPEEGTERSGAGVNNAAVPVVVPEEAEAVRLAFEWYATGQYSHASVAKALNDAGYRMVSKRHPGGYPFTKDTVTAMLQNRFYTGVVTLYGEEVRDAEGQPVGKHDPIISQDLFDRVQAIHGRKAHAAASPVVPLRRSIDGATVEEALAGVMAEIRLPDDWLRLIVDEAAGDAGEAERIAARRQALQRQLEQAQAYLLRGYITEAQFLAERAQIGAELATLTPPHDALDLEDAAARVRHLPAVWADATPEERRDIARALFDAVWVDLDARRVVAFQMKSTLRRLRSVLCYGDTGTDSIAICGRMRNRRASV